MIRKSASLLALLFLASAASAQKAPGRPPVQQVPQGWPIQDCNGNGIPDLTDIFSGTSADCNHDRIPDECQVAKAYEYNYVGPIEGGVGTNQDYICWLTNFIVAPGHEVVTSMELVWGQIPVTTTVTVGLWSDPDGDFDPTDAQLLASTQVTSGAYWTSFAFDFPDTYVGPAGTSFFVGCYGYFPQAPTAYPASLDTDSTALRSWWISGPTPIQPNNLPAGMVEFDLIGKLCSGCEGDWGLKALSCLTGHCGESNDINGNGIPDECEPDCNGNGIPDDWDILTGLSSDCDGNGVPDECQGLEDCDANATFDLCQQLTPFGLAGEYYATIDLSGPPLGRIDPQVNFDFSQTPPFPGKIPSDDFSVRWTGAVTAPVSGTYTFGVEHDDGVRLWVNGWKLVDSWKNTATAFHTGTVDLLAGVQYYLKLEYYDDIGEAIARLSWQPPGGVMNIMQDYELSPLYDRNQDGIPDTCQVVFDCNGNGLEDADDIAEGRSLDCNGDLVPDECQKELDCDDNGMLDSCELALPDGLLGQYWISKPGTTKFWERVGVRVDPGIDFDWGNGAPLTSLPSDDYAVRWTGTIEAAPVAGTYTFYVQADDGVRLWLDNVLVLDEWHPASGTWYPVDVDWPAGGRHLMQMDYFEKTGDAEIRLHWIVPGGSLVPVPTSALRPDTDIDGDGLPDVCL